MHLLLTCAPGLGHLLPLLPLARAAIERGHDVRVATGADLRPVVEAAGLVHLPAGPTSLAAVAASIPELAGLTGRRRAVTMVRHGFCDRMARGMAADLLAARSADPASTPDLIVHEDMELGGWLAAERLGIPHATVQVTAWRPQVRRLMAEAIGPVRDEHGLPADAGERMLGEFFFTTRPASMRDPTEPLPPGTLELRPIADDDVGGPGRPDVPQAGTGPEPRTRSGPRIAVTLGTVHAQQHDVLRAMVDGAAAVPGSEVIVGLGGEPAAFGPVRDDVRLHRYIPMSSLLPTVDAIASHGGSGTLTAALAAGVPMVIVPLGADQPDNADRASAAGVARVLDAEALGPDSVREALTAVLDDPTYRRRAREVAAEIAAMPGPEAAVAHLESIIAGQPAGRT